MRSATVETMLALDNMPVLIALAPMSSSTESICAATISSGTSAIAITSRVFCAVTAVIALDSVNAMGGKGLEIGLNSSAATGIGASDCQRPGYRQLGVERSHSLLPENRKTPMAVAIDEVDRCRPFAGMTRIRFGGLAAHLSRALSDARTPGNSPLG